MRNLFREQVLVCPLRSIMGGAGYSLYVTEHPAEQAKLLRNRPGQELMHTILRSQGLDVQIEPASKAPKPHVIPLEALFKMLEEKKREAAQTPTGQSI